MNKLINYLFTILLLVLAGCNNPLGSSAKNQSVVDPNYAAYLQAPGSFSITSSSVQSGQISFSWSGSNRAEKYIIKYRTVLSPSFTVASCTSSPCTLTGLTNETSYEITIQATNLSGSTPVTENLFLIPSGNTSIPSIPTSLAATEANGSVNLSWAASTGTGTITYNVLRSTTSGSGYSTIASNQSGTTYTDSTFTNGTTYYYVVNASNAGGTSNNSTEVSSTGMGGFAISSVTVNGASALQISWGASAGATSYSVKYGTATGTYATTLTNQTSPATISSLSAGTPYYFMVTANNASGSGSGSVNANAEVSATPMSAFAISSTVASSSEVVLSWGPSTGASSYSVKYGTSTGSYTTTLTNQTSPKTITGLINGSTYYFMVVANNSDGSLNATAESSSSPIAVPSVPTSLSATAANGSVGLSWNASTGSGTITYNVLRSTTSGSGYTTIASNQSGTTYTDSTVTNGTTYYYVVNASNAGGSSATSSQVTALPMLPPLTPTGLTATGAQNNIQLNWNATSGLGTITYNILRSTTSGSGYSTIASSQSGTTYSDLSVLTGTTYYYVVTASNAGGTSSNSSEVSAAALGSFSITTVGVNGGSALQITWGSSIGATSYSVKYGTTTGTYSTTLTSQTSPTTISSLTAGTPYFFMVTAINSSGSINASTESTGIPMATFTMSSATVAPSSSSVSWASSTGATSYTLKYGTVSGTYGTTVSTSATSPTNVTGLTGATTYFYRITAVNTSGSLDSTAEISQTTSLAIAQQWPFDAIPNPGLSYDFDSSLIEFSGGKGQLTGTDQVDDSDTSSGFAGGTAVGTTWDNTNSYIRLTQSGTPVNNASLDSSWAPEYSSLVNYWKMDNNWNDSVGSSNGTAAGDATFTSIAKVGSHSGTFDGTGDYVDVGTLGSFGSSRYNGSTIAFWVKTTDTAGCDGVLAYGPSSGRNNFRIETNCSANGTGSSGAIRIRSSSDEATPKVLAAGTTASSRFNNGNWNHVVITIAPATNTIAIYVNGISQALTYSAQASPVTFSNFAYSAYLGAYNNGGTLTSPRTGQLDDLAVFTKVLTAAQVVTMYNRQAAKYSGSLTSRVMDALATGAGWTTLSWTPTLPFAKELPITNELQTNYTSLVSSSGTSGNSSLATNLVGLWRLNEASWSGYNVVDATGTSSNGTAVSSATTVATGKFGRAGSFDGTNFLYVGNGNLVTGSTITLSAWVYQTKQTTSYDPVIAKNDGQSNANAYALVLHSAAGNGDVILRISSDGSNYTQVNTPAGLVPASTWTHIAATYNAGTYRIYVNGVSQSLTFANTSTVVTGPINNNFTAIYIAAAQYINNAFQYYPGLIDDVGMWSRDLNANEIKQLYRRGANQLKYQVRNCTASNCSDDSTGANWKGPDGTNQSYFSELHNMSSQSASPSGTTNTTLPSMLFSNFTLPVSTSRYFQYRTILESDDTTTNCNYGSGATWCSPELKSVTIDPVHYNNSAPTIINKTGVSYSSLSNFIQTLGSGGCSSGAVYNLGVGSTYGAATWYWWNGSIWTTADGTTSKANSASIIADNISTFATQVGTGTVYFKAYLQSSGTTKCELDNLELDGVL